MGNFDPLLKITRTRKKTLSSHNTSIFSFCFHKMEWSRILASLRFPPLQKYLEYTRQKQYCFIMPVYCYNPTLFRGLIHKSKNQITIIYIKTKVASIWLGYSSVERLPYMKSSAPQNTCYRAPSDICVYIVHCSH